MKKHFATKRHSQYIIGHIQSSQDRGVVQEKTNFVRNLTGPINVLFQLNMKYQDQQQKLKRKRGTDSYKVPRWAMWEGGWGTKT